jgi:hypothetical protein
MKKIAVTLVNLVLSVQFLQAQITLPKDIRIPTPAIHSLELPFFDARHGAMGNAGVATSSDEADIFWNPARTVFAPTKFGIFASYSPWSNGFLGEMYLIKTGGYYKLPNNRSALSVNLSYLNQLNSQVTSGGRSSIGSFISSDWALGINYAKKLSQNLSMGIGVKYVKSSLLPVLATFSLGFQPQPAETIAADISIFHQDIDTTKTINVNYGIFISNLSGRVSYGGSESNFIPTNLKIGIAPTWNINKHNSLTLAIDANKLMIPTPTVANGKLVVSSSAIAGILGSFSDAPDGLSEELQEIIWSMGLEYWYDKKVAVRIGKFIETQDKGGRNFTTFGVGTKIIKRVNIDVAYMYNASSGFANGDLWRANVSFGFNKFKTTNL